MSVESFLKLREIDSVSKMKDRELMLMKEQQDRLSKLASRREDSLMQSAKLKQDLHSSQQELFETEKKIKSAAEQKQRLMDIGGDENKIRSFQQSVDQHEEEGFALLEKIDSIQAELNDSKTFQTGLEKTIAEITDEVNELKAKSENEISNLDLRLTSLEEELPDDFKTTLSRVKLKKLAHGPFTRIENGSCFFCRYKISRVEESEIDMQKQLKLCPQCSRIFIPYGA